MFSLDLSEVQQHSRSILGMWHLEPLEGAGALPCNVSECRIKSACSGGQLELEADSSDALVAIVQPRAGQHSSASPSALDGSSQIVFFRPVDGNMAKHTILGSGFKGWKFNFMAQSFRVLEQRHGPSGKLEMVVLGQASGPQEGMKLSTIPYQLLAAKLKVWQPGETGFYVTEKMPPGW